MKRDLLARAGRLRRSGAAQFSVTEERFDAYLDGDRRRGRARARGCTTCWSFPAPRSRRTTSAARRTRTSSRSTSSEYISADQPAEDILQEIRRQGAFSIACHPHHRTTRRIEIGTCYLWDHRKRLVGAGRRLGGGQPRRSVLGDEPEALSRTSRTATSTSRSTCTRGRRCCGARRTGTAIARDAARERRRRADAVPRRRVEGSDRTRARSTGATFRARWRARRGGVGGTRFRARLLEVRNLKRGSSAADGRWAGPV